MEHDSNELLIWQEPPSRCLLRQGAAHVWLVNLEADSASVARMMRILSDAERTRACQFQFEHDQARYIVARGALRAILATYLGAPACDIAIETRAHGKPILAQAWATSGLHFSVSHSGQYGLYVFDWGHELGVDIECIRPMVNLNEIINLFFSERERAMLQALAPHQRLSAFFTCWTQKEAYVKVTGLGLSYPLDMFDVMLEHGWYRPQVRNTAIYEAADQIYLRILPSPMGFAAALAVHGAWEAVALWKCSSAAFCM